MAISCGIVGLPNVGKSTLFNALTRTRCSAENFPFCTIEPNQGRVLAPDKRLSVLSQLANSQKIIPAVLQMVDIAGLVRGASKGEGLGNQFLHHIREVDAILHVVRCFPNPQVIHVEGQVDPINDVETIETELILADIASLERWIQRSKSGKTSKTTESKERCQLWGELIDFLSSGKSARQFPFTPSQLELMKGHPLLTFKPMLIVANCSEDNSAELLQFQAYTKRNNLKMMALCITQEAGLSEMDESERQEMIDFLGIKQKLPMLILETMKLLGLQSFFTVGKKETRAWPIPKICTAQCAAEIIHSDIARGFIRAEVISYDDFVQFKGETQARIHGKLRLEGKEYLVQDGDIIHFRFNV